MATRLERVVLELDDKFSREMLKPAASVRLFREELKGLDKDSGAFSRTTSVFERDSARIGASIDRFSGRLALIAQSAGALGPALVPITTALVPAIAGLTTELGFAVAGAGVAILAFQGVGDTLDALNKAQLKPTAANIAKLREESDKLSPAARELVIQLDKMGPAFRQVRDAAQEGLLPGFSDALDNIESLLPKVASIVGEIGDVTGELLASGAESLAGPEWEDFFSFVEAEARPTLMQLGLTVGHVTKGLAEMWMAFDPLSDDFIGGLREASESFESWAEGLSDSEDFRAFVEYIRVTGPVVLETLGDIGNMFLQIGEAAAPLGGPVLEIIGSLADIIATVADSDLGTPIMTGVAALSAMNLVMSLTGKIGKTAFGGIVKEQGNAALGIRGVRAELELLRAEYLRTGNVATLTKLSDAAERNRQGLAAIGKGAALAVGGLAVMETGLASTKTAVFGLTGAMIGGAPGAVAGGLVGLTLDLAGANDELGESLDRTRRGLNNLDFAATFDGLGDARKQLDDFIARTEMPEGSGTDWLRPFTQSPIKSLGELKNVTEGLFGESDVEEERAKFEELAGSVEKAEGAVGALALAFGEDITPIWAQATIAADDWIRTVERATPAMLALGITVEELLDMDDAELREAADSIATWTRNADSAQGRTDTFAEAVKGLDDELLSTKDSAALLSDALDGLFDPALNLDAAVNNWKQALQTLKDDLDTNIIKGRKVKDGPDVPDREVAGSRELFGGSEGALQNQDALRERVKLIKDVLEAEAAAGASPERVAKLFRSQRDALIETATAAGFAKADVEKYLAKLELTPDVVETLFKTLGIPLAEEQADRLNKKLDRAARARVAVVTVKAINSGDRFGVSVQDRNDNGIPDYKEFYTGGFTGNVDPRQVVGTVHGGEVVIPAAETQRDWAMLKNRYGYLPGFADGGYVSRSVPASSYSSGSMAGLAAELAPLLAGLRPVMGDMHVVAHNINDIKRELDAAKTMASSDGVRAR